MKRIFLVLAITAISIVLYQCGTSIGSGHSYYNTFETADEMVEDAKARITEINRDDLKGMIDEMAYFVLIDIREQNEHDAGYISGSVLIPRGVLEFRVANESFWDDEGMYMPLKTDSLVVYCKKGNRTALAAESLRQLGYEHILCLDGGFLSWKEAFPELVQTNIDNSAPAGQVVTTSSDSGGC
jgi:rhodanese-related sulfurtransferase